MSGTVPGEPVEQRAHDMLLAAYEQAPLEVFGETPPDAEDERDALARAKAAADLLVAARFARYADEGRTRIELTNAGRYWALHGGFFAFLKEEPAPRAGGGGGRGRNPEMEELRMNYMRLRLGTFWWSFGLSLASFVFALVSLAVAYFYGERLLLK